MPLSSLLTDGLPTSRPSALKIATVIVAAATTTTWWTNPSSANLQDDIDKANNSSEPEIEPSELDIATADIADIADQLKALNRQVNVLNSKKDKFSADRTQSEDDAASLASEISETESEIAALEQDLAKNAVLSFQRQSPDSSVILSNEDPSDSMRKRTLSSSATRSAVEIAEALRLARSELAVELGAQGQFEENRRIENTENEANLARFEQARVAVASLAKEAEDRAQRVLAEADALGELDSATAAELRKGVEDLSDQVRIALGPEVEKAAQANPSATQAPTEQAAVGDMRQVQGIWVHKDIAENVDAMLNAARADGIELSGGGFRDPAGQIAVRKSNCGTSNYAVYEMPASSCRPPTARPGTSMHEQGKAIDITFNGSTIKSRSSTAFLWLSANAATYGLINLPSEPWHWSVNGR